MAAVESRADTCGGGRRVEASALAMARAAPRSVAHAWSRATRRRWVVKGSLRGGSASMAIRASAAMCWHLVATHRIAAAADGLARPARPR